MKDLRTRCHEIECENLVNLERGLEHAWLSCVSAISEATLGVIDCVAIAERANALMLALLPNAELETQTEALVLSSPPAMLFSDWIGWESAARNRREQDRVVE